MRRYITSNTTQVFTNSLLSKTCAQRHYSQSSNSEKAPLPPNFESAIINDNTKVNIESQINSEILTERKYHVIPSIFEQYGTPRPPTFSLIHQYNSDSKHLDFSTTSEVTASLPNIEKTYPDSHLIEYYSKHNAQLKSVQLKDNVVDSQPYYRLSAFNYGSVRYSLLRSGFKRVGKDVPVVERGYLKLSEQDQEKRFESFVNEPFSIYWGRHLPAHFYQHLNHFQRVNHFPGSTNLGRKDLLFINLFRQKQLSGDSEYGFFPDSFLLPYDYKVFQQRCKEQDLFILKPFASSCGRGISVYNTKKHAPLPEDKRILVQEYIANPLLIAGKKFDMRLYVLVSSYDPLRVYLHCDGLARFATEEYDMSRLDSVFSHLTNYSINKKSDNFVRNDEECEDEEDGWNEHAHKWSIPSLKTYLARNGYPVDKIWGDIEGLIVKTLISVENRIRGTCEKVQMPSKNNCFEIYGFDVMLDGDLKPWLIEVNIMPSLAVSSVLDKRVKVDVLSESFHILGMIPHSRANYEQEKKTKLNYYGESVSAKEKYILHDSEDELSRLHNFKRIYPPVDGNPARYEHLFQEHVESNKVLIDFEKEKRTTTNIESLHKLIA
ncbi:tubulin tyrosine ligase [Naegleria gruberi]|uniref:Tubulin--tyrosine ligase-like protein 5 n=1 Tax=Naegleria gruberi TaxID=5762 RepID=D2UY15_NAEGR|nr:tubulin tyrosine ligase [Naegleria gruberi]EFC50390.1 tubulin tyrosine ligase [Naegleria gruberi]|eukprot:XP_002683134.1 tubulin tyrosine ligase [Naegleria gruberi strain NEG-M]